MTLPRALVYLGEGLIDLRYGVSTRGLIRNETALRAVAAHGDAESYQPAAAWAFLRLLARVPTDPAATTFVDLGAGRGLALVLAATAGYRRVIGVELDPALAASAQANISAWASRPRRRVRVQFEVVEGDAADAGMPDGPLLVFVYNAFGAATLSRVVERLARCAAAGPVVHLLYLNPVHRAIVDSHPQARIVATGDGAITYRFTGA